MELSFQGTEMLYIINEDDSYSVDRLFATSKAQVMLHEPCFKTF